MKCGGSGKWLKTDASEKLVKKNMVLNENRGAVVYCRITFYICCDKGFGAF